MKRNISVVQLPSMDERRHFGRHRTYKGARIAFKDDRAAIQCVVRNLSDAGACLAVESPVGIPETFHLVFNTGEQGRSCRIVWRGKDRVGVAFQ